MQTPVNTDGDDYYNINTDEDDYYNIILIQMNNIDTLGNKPIEDGPLIIIMLSWFLALQGAYILKTDSV